METYQDPDPTRSCLSATNALVPVQRDVTALAVVLGDEAPRRLTGIDELAEVDPDDSQQVIELVDAARAYIQNAHAKNTLRAYHSDWRHFADWCGRCAREPLPVGPETLTLYLAGCAKTMKASTIQRRLSSIAQAHKAAGHGSPLRHGTVAAVWSGIKRTIGTAQEGKSPTLIEDIRAMVEVLPPGRLGQRDRALLLLGFAGGFRRSELVALDVADVALKRAGLVVTLRRSKTDQEGAGRKIGIPHGGRPETCPVRALKGWFKASGIEEGALFRRVDRHGNLLPQRLSDQAVALIVKRLATAAGRDPALFAGHSLRAGLATAAAAGGASERKIMQQTGHRSEKMLRKYIRDSDLFEANAAAATGL